MMRIHGLVLSSLTLLAVACADGPGRQADRTARSAGSTYEKFLVLAEGGDPAAQNLIGYMLYFGEGVETNRSDAHFWFHRSADGGHGAGALNLAVLHVVEEGPLANSTEAALYYQRAREGGTDLPGDWGMAGAPEHLGAAIAHLGAGGPGENPRGRVQYESYCAGCHGLNGVAAFTGSPSFAIGERLDETDAALLASISQGRGVTPYWDGKLSEEDQRAILAYIRTFPDRYRRGIGQALRDVPNRYFSFGPMAGRELGTD